MPVQGSVTVMFYTYMHRRADDGKVFYVGKGRNKRAWSKANRSKWWKNTVEKHGLVVDKLAEWPTEAEAFEHEKFLIACFRDLAHPLVNLTDGGEGLAGWTASAETRALLSAIRTGRKMPPRTASYRERMSAAKKGQTHSEETRRKMSESQRARKRNPIGPEARKNMARTWSVEQRAAHSEKLRGRRMTEETRARMCAGQAIRRARERAASAAA